MAEEELTDAEKQEVKDLLGYGSNLPDAKQNVHTFLFNVATADDTTKLGNLSNEELGVLQNPVRSYKHLSLFSKDIMKKEGLSKFFAANSEIGTSTSLSKEGFLINAAVTQKRELRDTTKKGGSGSNSKKSWFGGKKVEKEGEE